MLKKSKVLFRKDFSRSLKHTFLLVVFVVCGVASTGNTVLAAPTTPGTAPAQQTPANNAKTGETCAIEKVGWILCPIMEGASKAADAAFNQLAGRFLEIEPELLSSKDCGVGGKVCGTFDAWGQARNLANVMFIIAFIIIVYSQVTGAGLNNYGIKRMLPRLIIAAIAVNVSYYICQGMVDLSNLLGYNIKDGLDAIANSAGPNVFAPNAQGLNNQSTGGVLSAITIIGLGAAAVWLFVSLGASMIGLVLITAIIIVIILLLRKAILILLVVISPIAFVLYLLPNTEKLFNKWLSMFWKLLMVFPVVALLFGGGHLASAIVLAAGAESSNTQAAANKNGCDVSKQPTQTAEQRDENDYGNLVPCADTIDVKNEDGSKAQKASISLGLVATGIAVAPLLAVWSVLKGALDAAGAIGGKIGGTIKNMDSGARGRVKQNFGELKETKKNQLHAAALRGGVVGGALNTATFGSARRGAKRRAKVNYAKSALHTAETGYVADRAVDEDGNITGFGRSLSGGMLASDAQRNAVRGNAVNARNALEQEEMKAAHAVVDRLDPRDASTGTVGGQVGDQARTLIEGGQFDSPHLAALLEQLAKSNREAFMGLTTQLNGAAGGRETVASRAAGAAMSGMSYYSGGDAARVSRGEAVNLQSMAVKNIEDGGVSPAEIAGASHNEIETIHNITAGNAAARASLNGAVGRMTKEQQNRMSQQDHGTVNGW